MGSETWVNAPDQVVSPFACEPVAEGAILPAGKVPSYLPEKNDAIDEFATEFGIPPDAAKGGAEKEVGGRCQTAINLGSLGPSVRLTWRRRLAALRHGKAQCEPTEPTEGPTDFPRIRTL